MQEIYNLCGQNYELDVKSSFCATVNNYLMEIKTIKGKENKIMLVKKIYDYIFEHAAFIKENQSFENAARKKLIQLQYECDTEVQAEFFNKYLQEFRKRFGEKDWELNYDAQCSFLNREKKRLCEILQEAHYLDKKNLNTLCIDEINMYIQDNSL